MRLRVGRLSSFGAAIGVLLAGCGGDGPVPFADMETYDRPGIWQGNACGDATAPLLPTPGPEVTAVPYPTPSGGTVQQSIEGVPLPAGSELVESFVTGKDLWGGDKGAVRVYTTERSSREVFSFYNQALGDAGWENSGSTSGPAGVQCGYVPNLWALGTGLAPDHWIIITTEFVPPPGFEQQGDVPPGFRGKSVPFAPRVPGKTTFSVITPH